MTGVTIVTTALPRPLNHTLTLPLLGYRMIIPTLLARLYQTLLRVVHRLTIPLSLILHVLHCMPPTTSTLPLLATVPPLQEPILTILVHVLLVVLWNQSPRLSSLLLPTRLTKQVIIRGFNTTVDIEVRTKRQSCEWYNLIFSTGFVTV